MHILASADVITNKLAIKSILFQPVEVHVQCKAKQYMFKHITYQV